MLSMDILPMSNSELQNLHNKLLVYTISNAVMDAATCGRKKLSAYMHKDTVLSLSHDDLSYILSRVRQIFPESSVRLKVVSHGRRETITLSDLSLMLVSCPLNDDAKIEICVEWSKKRANV